jgi:hypothetical protein
MSHKAQGGDAEPPGWDDLAELFERADRHGAYTRAGRWALAILLERLGDDWLAKAISRAEDDAFPLALHRLGSLTLAVVEAVELAAQLELSGAWDGHADALRDLTRDPRTARLLHTRAQLSIAAMAARLGWLVHLEPDEAGRPPADLALTSSSGVIDIEVRVLTQSAVGRQRFATAERDSDWLMMLGAKTGVWIGGKVSRSLSDDDRDAIEDFVERNASEALAGDQPSLTLDGIGLTLASRGVDGGALNGPTIREDLFGRMVKVIAQKAERMRDSGASWLHVTALTGLWLFTPWGRSSLDERLAVMTSALDDALGDNKPEGIVLCSAAGLVLGATDATVDSTRGVALRRVIRPLRARETLIMGFSESARATIQQWRELVSSEPDWLEWALERHDLPTIDEIATVPPEEPPPGDHSRDRNL